MKQTLLLCLCILFSLISKAGIDTKYADSLYLLGQWENARQAYENVIKSDPSSVTLVVRLRLGYCYYNLKNYDKALENYKYVLAMQVPPPQKIVLFTRLMRAYSIKNDPENAFIFFDSLIIRGAISLSDLDTLSDYKNLRADKRYNEHYKKAYAAVFPCSTNPHAREFDFWIGEWNVYQTVNIGGTVVGHSLIQNVSGECLILENWTSTFVTNEGKSMNYIDPATGKWEQTWMGSGGGLQRFVNGEYKDGAMRFTYNPGLINGKQALGRFTFFNMGTDQVRQFQEASIDDGKTWQPVYDFTYIRIKK